MIAPEISKKIENELERLNIKVASVDMDRPWGGFYVIHPESTDLFLQIFFNEINHVELGTGPISPKILIVAPQQQLSWQYHLRREEIWKLIEGEAGLMRSETNAPSPITSLIINSIIYLKKEERHRLVGFDKWGIVAEIWKHTHPDQPSNEEDIIRLEDHYGRK